MGNFSVTGNANIKANSMKNEETIDKLTYRLAADLPMSYSNLVWKIKHHDTDPYNDYQIDVHPKTHAQYTCTHELHKRHSYQHHQWWHHYRGIYSSRFQL